MLSGNPDMPGLPVGPVDDDRSKIGGYVHGVKVMGTCDSIPRICASGNIDQIVVAVPSATKVERDRIYALCLETGLKTMTLPQIHDMPQGLDGKIALREVEIGDLLSRAEIALDLGQMGYVSGKKILVTGGGGSIGSWRSFVSFYLRGPSKSFCLTFTRIRRMSCCMRLRSLRLMLELT